MRQAEIPLFLLDIVVASDPFFLPSAGSLAGGNSTVKRVDSPAVTVRILPDPGMWEHRQHELALAVCQDFQQLLEILLVERTVIMGAVRSHVGRIHKVESALAVVAL